MLDPQHHPDLVTLAEEQGYEAMKGRLATAEWIAKQAEVTLTVLLAGIGGSLAFAVKLFEPGSSSLAWAAAGVCAWLSALAFWLVVSCLMVSPGAGPLQRAKELVGEAW
ncbi:hypothetical protein Y694_00778 [Methylibium sp. T29-B]|uniref:hypothetical protein n=1 Tax=Methylibium sp. T29-B TaxID=1437443 RepID=UPI0003F43DA1|nr:hypothetical protein [Methylibium sp. T29-B]EWS61504.1 hypothetical protein Y694_00778 [Methylibium sp. T29-B]